MDKVICDVCGTTYPDTSEQCPICGSANRNKTPTKAGAAPEEKKTTAAGYATKGGRFSKTNVRKRTQTGSAGQTKRTEQPREEEQNNTGLIVAVVLLLLAIIVVLIYIGVRYFSNSELPEQTDGPTTSVTGDPTGDKPTEEHRVPCQSLVLSNSTIRLGENNRTMRLVVQITPADSTDAVIFESSDESVATVSTDGVVTAVGNGEALITAKCGDQEAVCIVICTLSVPTDPSEPTTFDWILEWNTIFFSNNIPEVSLRQQGETWRCYKYSMNVAASEVTWWSANEDVCVVKNGIVTAVNYGVTRIYAQFNGETYYAIVRCTFRVQPPTEPTDPEVTDPEVTDPEVTDPEVTNPEVTDPEVTDPEVTDPEETDPEVTDPEVTDPEVTDPEVTDPEVTDPEETDPEETDPEVTDPGQSDASST